MPDYKKMYHTLFYAVEDAINMLIAAQEECEEIYITSLEAEEEKDEIVPSDQTDGI